MELTEEETSWAWAIKEALEEKEDDAELASTITDFEIAQHAIIAKNNVVKGLKRIHRLETFRKDHGIPPTAEMEAQDALQMIQRFEAMCPGMFLSFNKEPNQDFYVSTWQYSAFLPEVIKTPEDWKTTFAAFYYLIDAHHPNLEAMRAGMVMITEVQGMGWKNFSLEMEKHAVKLYQDAYPVRIKAMIMLNAPRIFRAMYLLVKPFLSKKVKEVIQLNAKLEEVQEVYSKDVLPTGMGGTQDKSDMEDAVLLALKTRYTNMASFKLPPKPTPPAATEDDANVESEPAET